MKRSLWIAIVLGAPLAGLGTGCQRAEPTPRRIVEQGTPEAGGLAAANPAAGLDLLHALAERDPWLAHNRSVERITADALGRMGPAAVPALIEMLSDPDPVVRRDAARTLGRIGTDARKATDALTVAVHDKDDEVRRYAIRALGQIGPGASSAVPTLVDELRRSAKAGEQLFDAEGKPIAPPAEPVEPTTRPAPARQPAPAGRPAH